MMFLWKGKKYNLKDFELFLKGRLLDHIEEWEKAIVSFALEWINHENQYFKVKTSGSTGKQKTIQLSRQQMIESAMATQKFLNLKYGDSALLVLPVDFIAGKMMIVRALEIGMDLYYFPPQVSVFNKIDRPYDFAAFIPLQIQFAIDAGQTEKLNYLNISIIGGAPLSDKYIAAIKNIKSDIYATYGMTETITHIAMKDLKQEPSSYKALPGIEFSVDSNNCLQIKSDRLPESFIKTKDVVQLTSSTTFDFIGRFDHIINSGGLKIIPEEIEEFCQKILGEDVFAGYQKDPRLGQKLVLVLESEKQNETNIIKKLKGEIPKNKIPGKVFFIQSFIRTENQKINRKKMQDWILNFNKAGV